MPLPQQVINQLSREPAKTPGWSVGILSLAGGVFVMVALIYFSLTLFFEPNLNAQVATLQSQTAKEAQKISSSDQTQLVAFYSQVSNLQALLQSHVYFSQFLIWLEGNTDANVYYNKVSFTNVNQIALGGLAKTVGDITEQIAILEASPNVKSVAVSNVLQADQSGFMQFNITLIMKPLVFSLPVSAATSTAQTPLPHP